VAKREGIKDRRDLYRKDSELSYILFGLGYLLVATEAYTTAHLAHFDVNENLSLRLKPTIQPMPTGQTPPSLTIAFNFH